MWFCVLTAFIAHFSGTEAWAVQETREPRMTEGASLLLKDQCLFNKARFGSLVGGACSCCRKDFEDAGTVGVVDDYVDLLARR